MAKDQHQGLRQPPFEEMKSFHSSPNNNINSSNKFTDELTFNASSNSVKPDVSNENLLLELERKGSGLCKPSKLEVGLDTILDRPMKFDVGIQNLDGKGEFSGLKLEENDAILHKPSKLEMGSENLDKVSEYSGLELEKKGVNFDKPSKLEVGMKNLDEKTENSELELENMGGIYDKPSKFDVGIENNDTRSDFSGLESEKKSVMCDKPSKLEVGIEDLDGKTENSGLELENKGGFYDKPSKFDVGIENNETRSDFSGLELEKKGVICDKPSKLEVSVENLDGKGKFSGVELEKSGVGDVDITDSCNMFEVGLEKKENSKVDEVCLIKDCSYTSGKCSVMIQVVDETALVDVVGIDHKKNKRKGKKGNVNLNGGKKRCVYTRKKLESLRFVNVKGQKKFWKEVYDGFTQAVKEEYDELGCFKHRKQGQKQQRGALMSNFNGHVLVGESTSENVGCDAETISSLDITYDDYNNGKDLAEEWSGEEESDDDYDSIQRPAFRVEGEPDFESGPPEDGLEYLRRVRWEAAHIPQVKVAKIDNSKINKEQSVYMPDIPNIEKCPPHLVPLQQWEEEFMTQFSEFRLALSCLVDTDSSESQQSILYPKEHTRRSSESMASLNLPSGGPMLSEILGMDPLTRVTMLKKRISLFDGAHGLSKDDCAWIFALCAAVDTPLDSDTCALLRCLLRKCAQLRATKSELDDEVVMLNILATISGRFFGQLDS